MIRLHYIGKVYWKDLWRRNVFKTWWDRRWYKMEDELQRLRVRASMKWSSTRMIQCHRGNWRAEIIHGDT